MLLINNYYVLVGSLLLGLCSGLVSVFAVLKKQGLLGDTLAHASLPGIAMAFLIFQVKELPILLSGALVSALLAAVLVYFLVTKTKAKMDAAMASILSIFFGVGIMLLTYIQHLNVASQAGLESFLFGQAASLLRDDILWMFGIFVVVFVLVVTFWKEFKLFIFDKEFGRSLGFSSYKLDLLFITVFVLAILISLQAVGVVLTAALFVTPGASSLFWTKRLLPAAILSTFFGGLAGVTGAFLSMSFDNLPTGPVIVLVLTSIFTFSFLFAPRKGIIFRFIGRARQGIKVRFENVLGRMYREYEAGRRSWTRMDVEYFNFLKHKKFLEIKDGEIMFTKKGLELAENVVVKHRLWETYLVHQMKIAPDHVHRDAEDMEHILDDAMVEELNKILGNPKADPHGKSIKIKNK